MQKKNDFNLTVGNPMQVILVFALPILFGNIFQQLYNVIDLAIIGNILGETSLAAVGATSAIYSLLIGFSLGITNGFSVVLARFYGAGDERLMKKTVSLMFVLTLIMSVLLTTVLMLGLRWILSFLNTPEIIFAESHRYLSIILMFSIVVMFYNMFAGMLRAIGNSRTPLVFLIISTVINIVLDILFVKYFSWGISGAAVATVLSQMLSAILCGNYIRKNCPILRFHKENLEWDSKLIMELVTQGLSMGLMIAICSIGTVALQGAINSFGEDTIAGHTAGRKIAEMFMMPLGTLSAAASTFTGQNYGAGKMDRVKKGILDSILLSFIWNTLSCLLALPFGVWMAQMLAGTTKPEIIDTAYMYIKINTPFFYLLSILLVLRSSLQGLGRKIVPLLASVIELLVKFAGVGIVAPLIGYGAICISEPAIWVICIWLVMADFWLFLRKKELTNLKKMS